MVWDSASVESLKTRPMQGTESAVPPMTELPSLRPSRLRLDRLTIRTENLAWLVRRQGGRASFMIIILITTRTPSVAVHMTLVLALAPTLEQIF